MSHLPRCRYCGGTASENLLVCRCETCGARTKNFTGCGGEYQREQLMAEAAWRRGEYTGPLSASIRELAASARPVEPAQPLAWLYTHNDDSRFTLERVTGMARGHMYHWTETPLFAHPAATAGAGWRERGEADPHGKRYDGERAALCMGNLTDDELANAVFLYGNERPSMEQMMAGVPTSIAYLTAAKDRIRWLSRKLAEALAPNGS